MILAIGEKVTLRLCYTGAVDEDPIYVDSAYRQTLRHALATDGARVTVRLTDGRRARIKVGSAIEPGDPLFHGRIFVVQSTPWQLEE